MPPPRRRRQPAPPTPCSRRAHAAAEHVARRLPPQVYFGTSSWTFPGWAGLVYPAGLSTTALGRDGLRHYARHPLLRTVGIDRSYYAPIPLDDLRAYAAQLPDGFRCCVKAPAGVTSRVEPTFGAARSAPRPNADFLSVDRLVQDLLAPLAAGFAAHTGPIVLEFPPGPRDAPLAPGRFAEALDRFLDGLPRDFDYAVEVRDRALLTAAYCGGTRPPRRRPHLQLLECHADAADPGGDRRRPSRRRSPSSGCCSSPARGTKINATGSGRSTAWSRPTRRCAARSSN